MSSAPIKVRNSSIDIFRYVCAIMVVAVHTHPFTDINENLGYVFTQIVPRIAVPFFFCVAGYFYIQKLERNEKPFFPYIKKILVTYSIWSLIYFLINFCSGGYSDIKKFILYSAVKYVFAGSHYHLWYFPALIFAVCLTTLLYKIKCKKLIIPLSIALFALGCIGCAYYSAGVKIPLLGKLFTMPVFETVRRVFCCGFPFFVSGYVVYLFKNKTGDFQNKKALFILLGGSVAIWLAEIFMVIKLGLQQNIYSTFGLYLIVVSVMAVLVKFPAEKFSRLSGKTRVIANFTYYSHPIFISAAAFSANRFLNLQITATPMFLLTVALTFVFGLLITFTDNRLINTAIK